MNKKYEIRLAQESDAVEISRVILKTSIACCFTAEEPCPEWYRESVQPGQIQNLLSSSSIEWLVAIQEETITGVLAISDKSHIKYFFVKPDIQKSGVGRQLWNRALQIGALGGAITVRSSIFAVPVYERLGFRATEQPKMFNGLRYQAMAADYA